MDMELDDLKPTGNNNDGDKRGDEVCTDNGSCPNHNTPEATEDSHLLSAPVTVSNEAYCTVGNMADGPLGQSLDKPVGTLCRLKNELNETACWKLRVWMLILISFILIFLVIFLSVYFCSVHKEDVDDKYNVEEFVVPYFFRGNFTLLNKTLTLDVQSQSILNEKLTHIYTSSYALGRYFSLATVHPPSNSSVKYELKFMIPEEHQQMIQYTLSKEMVYNVLLQQLFDQDNGDPLYIEPFSLTMQAGR